MNRQPPAKSQTLPTLIDIATAAHHLGVTPRHIRRLVAERRIPYLKVGHYVRFDPGELEAWLNGHKVQPAGGPHFSRWPDSRFHAGAACALFLQDGVPGHAYEDNKVSRRVRHAALQARRPPSQGTIVRWPWPLDPRQIPLVVSTQRDGEGLS
jgi:excisionase family DNA binding protein